MANIWNHLEMLDKAASLAVNNFHNGFTDAVMPYISRTAVWIPLYVIVMALLVWRLGWKGALVAVLALAINVVLADQIANLFKNGVHRLRPCYDEWMMAHGLHCSPGGGKFGFYSGHAANVFSFAICSLICLAVKVRGRIIKPRTQRTVLSVYGIFIFLWAITVSISRVYLGRHFIGDITVGAFSGLLTGLLMALAARAAIKAATQKRA